jgi:hypothetical protein
VAGAGVMQLSDQPKDSTPRKSDRIAATSPDAPKPDDMDASRPKNEEVLRVLELAARSESWRNPLPDKVRVLSFVPDISEEQIIEIEQRILAEIDEAHPVWVACYYDNPYSKKYERLRIERSLSALQAWTQSRLSDGDLPRLKAARIWFWAAPTEEWLPNNERDDALSLMGWMEEMKSALPQAQKSLLDNILHKAMSIENAKTSERPISQPPEISAPKLEAKSPPRSPGERGGRPRKDPERQRIIALRYDGKTWPQIATIISKETGETTTAEACRKLANATTSRTKPGQN